MATSFSYFGHNVNKFSFLVMGGTGCPINYQTGPILLPSYPRTYVNLHIKYGINLIRIC